MTPSALDRARVRSNFDGHADEYDRYARVQRRVAARLAELAGAAFPARGLVLDLGCGTGEAIRQFRARHPRARFVASDLAHAMTVRARAGLPDVLAADADAQSLPFREGCLAGVISTSVFQWLDDLPGAFRECHRVLAPGGLFACALFGAGTLRELHASFREALRRTASARPCHVQEFPMLETVAAALAAGGFVVRDCHAEEEREHHPTFRALMASLKGIGAQNATRERPGGLFPRQVMAEMTALYGERFCEPEGLPASYTVIYVLAVKREEGGEGHSTCSTAQVR